MGVGVSVFPLRGEKATLTRTDEWGITFIMTLLKLDAYFHGHHGMLCFFLERRGAALPRSFRKQQLSVLGFRPFVPKRDA
jgi:hypothetical protein